MASYRVTIRYGDEAGRTRYEMVDVEAPELGAALRAAAERIPEAARATADLAEIRLQATDDGRERGPV
jgi:hypothetical protein